MEHPAPTSPPTPPPSHDECAEAVCSLMARLGLSKSRLGYILGASTHTVYQWSKGNARPNKHNARSLDLLRQIADHIPPAIAKDFGRRMEWRLGPDRVLLIVLLANRYTPAQVAGWFVDKATEQMTLPL